MRFVRSFAVVACLSTGACLPEPAGSEGSEEATEEITEALTSRPIEFPELVCRDAQGTGANLYMFRNADTYSQILFFTNGVQTSSGFQEQEIQSSTSTIHMVPSSSTLSYGQTPHIFTMNGVSYPCQAGPRFETCVGLACLQPPVYVGTSPPPLPPPPIPTASADAMKRALDAQRSAAVQCAPTFHGTIQISASFDRGGEAISAAVRNLSAARLSSRKRSCMEVAFSNASGAGGQGTITHNMSL